MRGMRLRASIIKNNIVLKRACMAPKLTVKAACTLRSCIHNKSRGGTNDGRCQLGYNLRVMKIENNGICSHYEARPDILPMFRAFKDKL
jgi:hypothetical protein